MTFNLKRLNNSFKMTFNLKRLTNYFDQVNGDNNGHSFQEVQLEGSPSGGENNADTTSLGSGGGRGERVKQEISLLSPAQHQTHNQNESGDSGSSKPRPEDLGIKTFVPSKPLPVPTPSREATLTQKLEQALGKEIRFYLF
jgi:hypothetical protein